MFFALPTANLRLDRRQKPDKAFACRLEAANVEQLEDWADRILDATTLQGVFEDA
jgi:hypothetical protein